MGKSKRKRARVAGKDRQNLRLWAEGVRESILVPHLGAYSDALERGWRQERDYLQKITNEFHAKVDWRLKDFVEPELPLPEYDPTALVEEEMLSPEESTAKSQRVALLNARIARWLKYRVRRLRKGFNPKLDPTKDPWAILLGQLSGLKSPPKARQAYQQYMRDKYETDIAPEVARRWKAQPTPGNSVQMKKANASFRASVARSMFAELGESVQAAYGKQAKDEAAAARKVYDDAMKAPPSRAPQDRQKCIDNVGEFLGPILKGINERTGLHSVVILGGPMPDAGGELRTVYCSYGRNRIGTGSHFLQWAGERFETSVLGLMTTYLETAFSTAKKKTKAKAKAQEKGKAKAKERKRKRADEPSDAGSEEEDREEGEGGEGEDEMTWDQRRAANKQRNKALLHDLGLKQAASLTALGITTKKGAPPKPRTKKSVPTPAQPPRKSRRLNTEGSTSDPAPSNPTADASSTSGPARSPPDAASTPALPPSNPASTLAPPPPNAASTPSPSNPASTLAPSIPNSTPTPSPFNPASSTLAPSPPTPTPTPTLAPFPPTSTPTPSPSNPASKQAPSPPNPSPTPLTLAPPPPNPTPTPSPSNLISADTPSWLSGSVQQFQAQDLGCHFTALLGALVTLETTFGFDKAIQSSLPRGTKRPQQIQKWISRGRSKVKKVPAIDDLAAYAKEWTAWWDALQPEWRKRDHRSGQWAMGGDVEYGPDDKWGDLDAPGPNGCLSLVAGLYFWGVCEDQSEEVKTRWTTAVLDVTWMLEGLTRSMDKQRAKYKPSKQIKEKK
ncbi:hypothetical protein B0H16DRAFT_1343518 [Mycena metata]|uniref:Uncharacterized protein n=1 Tax=Mycena metata TaxID=1033252 RepID=A0AAD7MDI9_9AGAR|nr:hypothetical protein B0H16DRAFT_1343518 [Mycena metata]